jgi:Bifunctional DNA primase/polymerase, N-terminal
MKTPIWEAGFELASQDHPVLPVAYGGKRPLLPNGCHGASTDPAVIALWAIRWPVSNLGLRADGRYILDLDGEPAYESLEVLERHLGPLPRTRTQRSRPGHEHRLFRLPAGVQASGSSSALDSPPGIDVRSGAGGYIVVAPSLHPSGTSYELDDRPEAELPWTWVAKIQRRHERRRSHEVRVEDLLLGQDNNYGRAALLAESEKVVRAAYPGRHEELNRSAFKCGQLVPHCLSYQTVATTLVHAAVTAHAFDPQETVRIVRCGLEAGMQFPRGPR